MFSVRDPFRPLCGHRHYRFFHFLEVLAARIEIDAEATLSAMTKKQSSISLTKVTVNTAVTVSLISLLRQLFLQTFGCLYRYLFRLCDTCIHNIDLYHRDILLLPHFGVLERTDNAYWESRCRYGKLQQVKFLLCTCRLAIECEWEWPQWASSESCDVPKLVQYVPPLSAKFVILSRTKDTVCEDGDKNFALKTGCEFFQHSRKPKGLNVVWTMRSCSKRKSFEDLNSDLLRKEN